MLVFLFLTGQNFFVQYETHFSVLCDKRFALKVQLEDFFPQLEWKQCSNVDTKQEPSEFDIGNERRGL